MTFDALLTHRVTITRVTYNEAAKDDRGQPARVETTVTDVPCLVQPRTERETPDSRSAGAPIGDHVVFMRQRDLDPQDVITWETARLEITGIRNYDFGSVPHLEVDCRRIAPPITT